jgi:effector-binding domain-containing protein
MGPGLREVYAAIAAQDMEPDGPWFTHHLKRPEESFDFEICVPTSRAIDPAGEVEAGIWPAMRVARTVYRGDYAKLGDAWGEFTDWIATQGLRQAEDLWERYLAGPDTNKDPARWRTELIRPLVD